MPTKKSTPSSRTTLSRTRVLKGALRIADKEGIEALSMRRLAQVLGVEAMSLYGHLKNKDAILDGIVELAMSEVWVPTLASSWKQAMRERAMSARAAFLRHPWAPALSESRKGMGPVRLKLCDAVLGVLRQSGFSLELAQHAFLTIDSYIYGFTLQESNWLFGTAECREAVEVFLQNTPLDDFQNIAEMAEFAAQSSTSPTTQYEAQFMFGLELILEALERKLGEESDAGA